MGIPSSSLTVVNEYHRHDNAILIMVTPRYELLRLISGTMAIEGNAKSCTLSIDYREDLTFLNQCCLQLPAFLKPFDVVTINLRSIYQNPRFRISQESCASMADNDSLLINAASVQLRAKHQIDRLISYLQDGMGLSSFETGLGPVVSSGHVKEGGQCLVFHPKQQGR